MSTATPTLPIHEVNGQPLNPEQQSYLDGLFAGLRNRGFRFDDISADPVPPPAGVKEPGDLILEERIKRELHPLDSWSGIVENARGNRAPGKEDVFRFKWHGLFYLAPNKEGYMCRLRIPGGVVRSFQLAELARLSKELTSGYVQVTTRANFQLRIIEPKNAPELLHRIQGIGLHSRGSGADNIRNITASPTAGVDPHELIDVLPHCDELAQFIINHREFYNLPRKFNIAFDGGGLIGTVEDTNDIGIKAVKVKQNDRGLEPGIRFRIALGGATGHKAFANDLGVLVKPEDLTAVVVAIIRVFIANGNRGNRKRARLKHLLDDWTLEQYLEETEKLLPFKPDRDPLDEQGRSAVQESRSLPVVPHSHIGAFSQKQPGLNYLGIGLPAGQLTPKQMSRLAEIADHYGSGEVRLTVWQNLVIPNIPDAFVGTVKKAITRMGLHWEQSHIRGGIVACTGNSYCKYASANTKGHALELGAHLEKKLELDQPINIHLTGCPHSCAQHYIGDIGLLAAQVKLRGESVEGYHVFVGGGFGEHRAVGRQVFKGIPFDSLKATLERMLRAYLEHRKNRESFREFTQRQDLNTLQTLFCQE